MEDKQHVSAPNCGGFNVSLSVTRSLVPARPTRVSTSLDDTTILQLIGKISCLRKF